MSPIVEEVTQAQKTPDSMCVCALTQPFHDLFISFQTTQRGSWLGAEAGHSRTRPCSTCPFSSLMESSRSRPAPARWPSECAAATKRATSCRATQRPTVFLPASAEEHSLLSWPVSLSCWVSYDLLLRGCTERSQWTFVVQWYLIWHNIR